MQAVRVPERIRIGTRASDLALWQTDAWIQKIHESYPQVVCEKVILRTTGDRILDRPLLSFGGKAVFVNEFEDAILDGRMDYAVHSAKDMPNAFADGLSIACVLPREDDRDVLVTRKGTDLAGLSSPVVGTGSLRRRLQLEALYPNACCAPLRGNVPTRLEKLRKGEYDGIILAAAGLKRLGLLGCEDLGYRFFSRDEMVPAGGQGIIAIEGRTDADHAFLASVSDETAALALAVERYILGKLGAGCHEAVGVNARIAAAEGDAQDGERKIHIRLMRERNGSVFRTEGSAGEREWKSLADALCLEDR